MSTQKRTGRKIHKYVENYTFAGQGPINMTEEFSGTQIYNMPCLYKIPDNALYTRTQRDALQICPTCPLYL